MDTKELETLKELAAETIRECHSGAAVSKIMEYSDLSGKGAKKLVNDVILERVATAPEAYWLDSVRGCLMNTKVLPTVYTGPDGTYFITEDTPELPNPVPEYTVRQILVTSPMLKLDVFSTLEDAKTDANLRSGL